MLAEYTDLDERDKWARVGSSSVILNTYAVPGDVPGKEPGNLEHSTLRWETYRVRQDRHRTGQDRSDARCGPAPRSAVLRNLDRGRPDCYRGRPALDCEHRHTAVSGHHLGDHRCAAAQLVSPAPLAVVAGERGLPADNLCAAGADLGFGGVRYRPLGGDAAGVCERVQPDLQLPPRPQHSAWLWAGAAGATGLLGPAE